MTGRFDPYYKWLAIPPRDQPPTHYRLLGVEPFESDVEVIANAADQRMAHLRQFSTGEHVAVAQRLLNEVANARTCLLNSNRKQQYDKGLRDELDATGAGGIAEAVFDDVQPVQRAKATKTIPAFPGIQVSERKEQPLAGVDVAVDDDRSGAADPALAAKLANAARTGRQNRPGATASPEKKPHPKAGQIRVVGHIIAPILGLLLGVLVLWFVKPSYFGGESEPAPRGPTALDLDNQPPPRRRVRKPPPVPRNQPPNPDATDSGHATAPSTDPAGTDGGNDMPLPGTLVNANPPTGPAKADAFNAVDSAVPPEPPVQVAAKEKTPEEKRQELQSRLDTAVEQFEVSGALDRAAELAELDGTNPLKAKFETFETCHAAAAGSPEKLKTVAEAGLVLLDELISAGNQAAAQRVALATLAAAKESKDTALFGKAALAFQKAKPAGSGDGS